VAPKADFSHLLSVPFFRFARRDGHPCPSAKFHQISRARDARPYGIVSRCRFVQNPTLLGSP